MSKISQYLKALTQGLSRRELGEEIKITRDMLKKNVLPVYTEASKQFKGNALRSKSGKEVDKAIGTALKLRGGSFITPVLEVMQNLDAKLDKLEAAIDLSKENLIMREAITVMEYNVIRLLENVSFMVEFAPKLLNMVISAEINYAKSGDDKTDLFELKNFTKAQVDYIVKNIPNFVESLNLFKMKEKELDETLRALPDLIISEDNADQIVATVGKDRADPFKTRFIPVFLNPFYHVGMYRAAYQADRYDLSVDEAKMLQFKLMQLQQVQRNENNPSLERQIEVTQERLDRLNHRIAQYNEQYGIPGTKNG